MSKEVCVHKLLVNTPDRSVIALFFPVKLSRFLEQYYEKYGEDLSIKTVRGYLGSVYPELLSLNFSKEALKQKEPWLYLMPETSKNIIQLIYGDFLEHLQIQLAEEQREEKVESFYGIELEGGTVKLKALYDTEHYFVLMESVLSRIFLEKNPPLKKIKSWLLKNEGNAWSVTSVPFSPDQTENWEKRMLLSYNIEFSINKEESTQSVLCVEPKYSTTRYLYDPLTVFDFDNTEKRNKEGQLEKEKRSIFFLFKQYNQDGLIRFQMDANGEEIRFFRESVTMNRIKQITGENVDIKEITREPSRFFSTEKEMIALIPYKPADKNKPNNKLEAGLATLDKRQMLDLCIEAFAATFAVKTEIIDPLPTSKKEGKVFPEWLLNTKEELIDTTYPICVYTREEEKLKVLIEKALVNLNRMEYSKKAKHTGFIFIKDPNQENKLCFSVFAKDAEVVSFAKNSIIEMNARVKNRLEKVSEKEKTKMKRQFNEEEKGYHKNRLNDYCRDHFKENSPVFKIQFTFEKWTEELFGPLDVTSSQDDGKQKRREQLRLEFPETNAVRHNLIEIDDWEGKNKKTDPKKWIEEVLQENKHITQMFHPEGVEKKVRSTLFDLFARKGFVDESFAEYLDVFNEYTIYTPVAFHKKHKKEQLYVYAVSKLEEGKCFIRYEKSDWMTLEESIVYLTPERQKNLVKEKGFVSFYEQVISEDGAKNPLVLLDELTYKTFKQVVSYDSRIPLVVFDLDANRVPVVTIDDHASKTGVSKGTALSYGSDGFYYSISPKAPTDNGTPLAVTKQESNKALTNRLASKMKVHYVKDREDQDKMAIVCHLLRNITVTYASFVNDPYTKYIFRYHKGFIK